MKKIKQYNSDSLKRSLPEAYREFFDNSEVVVSAPFIFFWAGEYAVMHGAFALLQKVPLRIYVGLELRPDDQILIADYTAFDAQVGSFEKREFNEIIERKLVKKIREILAKDSIKLPCGFNIRILVESPFNRAFKTTGSLCVSLATAIRLYFYGLDPRSVAAWAETHSRHLITDDSLGFDKTFRFAWKLESVFHADASSGAGVAASIIHSIYPVLYFSEKRFGDQENNLLSKFPSNIAKNYNVLDRIMYFFAKLDELANLETEPIWPIDFCLVSTGLSKDTYASIKSTRVIQEDLEQLRAFYQKTKNYFKRYIKPEAPRSELLFNKILPGEFWAHIIKKSAINNIELVSLMERLLVGGAPQYLLDDFIRIINAGHGLFQDLDLTTYEIERLRSCFREKYHCGSKLIGSGRGGDLLFVAEQGNFSEDFRTKKKELENLLGKKLMVDYANWRDGYEKDGVRVEQFLARDIVSDIVSGDMALITVHASDQPIKKYVTFEKLKKLIKEADLFLDYSNSKIYIKGQLMTSKKLHSTTKTLEIFKTLLEKSGCEITTDSFPKSSYIDRNEMQSKIISPLQKYFKQRTNKRLPLVLSGGLAKDFKLCLKIPKNIKIITV